MRHLAMLARFLNVLASLRAAFQTRAELALENLALRQQLGTLRRSSPRPRLRLTDRAFWVGLSQIWSRWSDALVIVKPDTVVRWHRAGFRLFWRWKSRSRTPTEDEDAPEPRAVHPRAMGKIVELPEVGGLHHRYERRAA
jgi:hypothetical protein